MANQVDHPNLLRISLQEFIRNEHNDNTNMISQLSLSEEKQNVP